MNKFMNKFGINKLDIQRRIAALGLSFAIIGSLSGCQTTGTKSDDDKQPIESDQVTIEATEEPPIESEQVVIETTEEPPTESDQVTISGDEYISLDSLKILFMEKSYSENEELIVSAGYFRWDYKDDSQSVSECPDDFDVESGTFEFGANTNLYNLYFVNALTGEIVNLNEIKSVASDVYFHYTDAGNYISLESVVDNVAPIVELEKFIDSCTVEDFNFSFYRGVSLESLSLKYAAEDSDLDATFGKEPLVKVKK